MMSKRRFYKRFTAVLMTFCMVLLLAPVTVFANEDIDVDSAGAVALNDGSVGTSNGTVDVDTTYVSGINADRRDEQPNVGTISFSMNESCFVWNSKTDGVNENKQYTILGKRVLGYAGAVDAVTFNDDGVVVIDVNYSRNSDIPNVYDADLIFGLYTNDRLREDARVDGEYGVIYVRRDEQKMGRAVYKVEKGKTYYLGASVPLLEDPSSEDIDKKINLDISVRHYRNYGTAENTIKDKSSLYIGAYNDQSDLYEFNASDDGIVSISIASIYGYDKSEESDYTVGSLDYWADAVVLDSEKNEVYAPLSDMTGKFGGSNLTFGVKGGQTYYVQLTCINQDPVPYKIGCSFTKIADQAGSDKSKAPDMTKKVTYTGVVPVGVTYTGWYKINLTSPADLSVYLATDYNTGIDFKVYNSQDQEVQDVSNCSSGSGQNPQLVPAGTYYVKVTKEATEGCGGGYSLEWTCTTDQSPANNNTANSNANGGTNPGTNNTSSTGSTGSTKGTSRTTVTSGTGRYKVTGTSAKKTVAYAGAKRKNAKSVTVPATVKIDGVTYKVTSIANNAFKNNKKLTKIIIGKNVKSIGSRAFSECKNLKTIIIKSEKLTKKSVNNKAFSGVSSKTKIKVPKNKAEAYKKMLPSKGLGKNTGQISVI